MDDCIREIRKTNPNLSERDIDNVYSVVNDIFDKKVYTPANKEYDAKHGQDMNKKTSALADFGKKIVDRIVTEGTNKLLNKAIGG